MKIYSINIICVCYGYDGDTYESRNLFAVDTSLKRILATWKDYCNKERSLGRSEERPKLLKRVGETVSWSGNTGGGYSCVDYQASLTSKPIRSAVNE